MEYSLEISNNYFHCNTMESYKNNTEKKCTDHVEELTSLIKAILSYPLCSVFDDKVYINHKSKGRKYKGEKHLKELLSNPKTSHIEFKNSVQKEEDYFSMYLDGSYFRISTSFTLRNNEDYSKIKSLLNIVLEELDKFAIIGDGAILLEVENLPQIKPSRMCNFIQENTIMSIINPKQFETRVGIASLSTSELEWFQEPLNQVRKLEKSNEQLPTFSKYEDRNGVQIIDWLNDLSSEDKIIEQLIERNKWVIDYLDPPPAPGFKENGDEGFTMFGNIEPYPPLTLFNYSFGYGFKATVLEYLMEENSPLMKDLEKLMKKGEMPKGEELRLLYIILPNRESCIAGYDFLISKGIKGIIYAIDDGYGGVAYNNPFPEGNWIEHKSRKL